MTAYVKKTLIVFIIVLLASLFLTIFGVYLPLAKEIELNSLEHFNLVAETKVNSFYGTVEKNIQAARSLSSRSAIRDKIVEYLNGTISFEELSSFTQEKYLDGVGVIENLSYATRVVDNKEVAEFYNDIFVNISISDCANVDQLRYYFKRKGDVSCMEVISPIIYNDQVIGHDIVGFCLNGTIEALNSNTSMTIELSDIEISKNKLANFNCIYEDKSNVYYSEPVDQESSIIVYQLKTDVFKTRDRLTKRSALLIIAGYGILLLIFYIFLVKHAKRQIKELSLARDNYKEHADKDALTGAYSRLFLHDFINSHPHEKGILILIDIDSFKKINDTYGHVIGDDVLKTIVSAIKKSIRDDDLVIRYGGDEFLIILRRDGNDKENNIAAKIIDRIKTELSKQTQFQFNIDFSYGITPVDSMLNIAEHINDADKKMYLNKREKANTNRF